MILQTLSEGWDLMRVDQHLTQSWPNSEIQFPGSAWWTCFGAKKFSIKSDLKETKVFVCLVPSTISKIS